jgi:hypothetical protein
MQPNRVLPVVVEFTRKRFVPRIPEVEIEICSAQATVVRATFIDHEDALL